MADRKDVYYLWIDWKRRVISFHAEKGFDRKAFPTHKEMFDFAVQRGFEGFGIQ